MPPPPHLPPRGEYRPRLLASVLALAGKDLRLLPRQGGGLGQGLLLGLLLIFLFSLASAPGQPLPARMAAAVFWTASLFCQTLLFSALYALEETDGQRQGLLLTPLPLQAVWLGKALGGFCLLLAAQGLLLPATAVFLGQGAGSSWLPGLAVLLLADLGTAVLGSLLGALAQGSSARESLLGILLFPLQAPLLLAGIALGTAALGGPLPPDPNSWLILALAFDAVFLAAGLGLFAHIYNEGG
ncbi:MAG: heme exporter protein CcmB [Desulfovibrio sp.]|nr:heme exporter protein CcmB [Desulfovibrio sp.]